ncbi:response regulator [Chloroflexia bacterium SDU3-3]|nr:response regulator [Chloroflexia bacterium SDU3-3]
MTVAEDTDSLDTRKLLRVLMAVKKGDFSVRMPDDHTGIAGKIADTLNDIIALNERTTREFERISTVVGTEGRLSQRASLGDAHGSWDANVEAVNTLISTLAQPTTEVINVIGSVARGDLSRTIPLEIEGRPLQGDFLRTATMVNTMVDQLNGFASEVTRVAREVGTDGKLGGQAEVKGVAGVWKDLTDNVNSMANNLTGQVRNIAEVTTAVANGDLSKKITADARGEILELKDTINTMVDQLNSFASEVTRVAREVGTDGKLGGQAQVKGVAGVWKDLTDNVNSMANNLTGQVRNIADVTTAVAGGDLSKKITADAQGEILELKNTINTMVDQLNSFASEVTRVAREVGTDGKLGGQAEVKGVGGTWKDLTDNVNLMANNLTTQVRNIAEVTTAVAGGDLSKKITADAKGEILDLKNTINTMVDQLNGFASEVTRVAREVGTDGKLGGQAQVKGVGGTWKDLTDNVNLMANNLTTQVRNIADVTTAVAKGDLSRKITVDAQGEILELKNTINTMVDLLNGFASEVTRVAREVGTEGKLGGQAEVKGVGGTWKDLTDNVNLMANNLTTQVRNIAEVTTAVAGGDLSKKITADAKGEILDLKNTINTMVDQLNSFASEVTRIAREVGTEGKLGGQAYVRGVGGVWKDLTDNVNSMASNLTGQVRNIADVTKAVANGDLSRKITADAMGEILDLKDTINRMVDQLNSFGSEVTRVAREVGTDGILGGQANVPGVAGIWKELSDNVNSMANNLTGQVRGIARVVTAVANGNLKRKLTLDAKGEIAALAETINEMIDTLATFADQVTTVAREVGIEGKLGGQANVPGASGTWRDLTDNVNRLAANLTTQIRTIAEIATAVTKGDLNRSIDVEAQGEVAELKDNINQMIANLRDTTLKNTEQDWLKTNLARFSRLLQGQRELETVTRMVLSELAPLVHAQKGLFYMMSEDDGQPLLRMLSAYAFRERKHISNRFRIGEGLVGQCALEKDRILITDVPRDYIQISSGLGEAPPRNIVVLPVVFEGQVRAVIELASFQSFSDIHLTFLDQLMESIGIVLNTIEANMRTEVLLSQSQSLAEELQGQQAELTETNQRLEEQARTLKASEELLKQQREQLQQTNEELEEKAELLARQNLEVERKNREIELARQSLEEKAEQLALSSKYKNEFLANMSHELRTPLNSMLILSKLLAENVDRNLSEKQTEFANTIYASGSDLLSLINDILDLAKIESGTMSIDADEIAFADLRLTLEQGFRPLAHDKQLEFTIDLDSQLPRTITTDTKRLQQVLRNLLSNAFKFTEQGGIHVKIAPAQGGWSPDSGALNSATRVIAFSVSDTGIGIPADKQRIIFEAFQQVDGTTSRKYGGTGLGLSISREIATLLGGEIRLSSEIGQGSTFTLYIPDDYYALPSEGEPAPRREPPSLPPRRPALPAEPAAAPAESAPQPQIADDRAEIHEGDHTLLIIEDDPTFARILLDTAREKGFKGIVSLSGEEGLLLARQYRPQAITLDLVLPGVGGWTIFDRLKHDPSTRHIPVHIISGVDERQRGMHLGAIAYLTKPVTKEALDDVFTSIHGFLERKVKNLLIVEDDEVQRQSMIALIGNGDVHTTAVGRGEEALAILATEHFDCMVLDLGLPDMSGVDLIKRIKQQQSLSTLPIIVYTGKDLSRREETELKRISDTIIIKDVQSMDRLLDETALFLHRVEANLPQPTRQMLEELHKFDPVLAGKKVLIVDDDVRNIFALTSVLERHNMQVVYAENGRDGIEILQGTPEISIVLMDVMMPEMDGYDTMRAIRKQRKYKALPIIALTAKAMKGDREKCIEAGASDYITKPVDTEQLLSLLRVWLYK